MILTVTNNASKPLISPVFIENPIELSSSQTLPVSSGSSTKPIIDVNPPAVVVFSNESSPQFVSHHRLRGFSGNSPCPSHEADYDTWRASVEILIKDPSVSDLYCTHDILDRLLPPASEMINLSIPKGISEFPARK